MKKKRGYALIGDDYENENSIPSFSVFGCYIFRCTGRECATYTTRRSPCHPRRRRYSCFRAVVAGTAVTVVATVVVATAVEIGTHLKKTWDGTAENLNKFVSDVGASLSNIFSAQGWIYATSHESAAMLEFEYCAQKHLLETVVRESTTVHQVLLERYFQD